MVPSYGEGSPAPSQILTAQGFLYLVKTAGGCGTGYGGHSGLNAQLQAMLKGHEKVE